MKDRALEVLGLVGLVILLVTYLCGVGRDSSDGE